MSTKGNQHAVAYSAQKNGRKGKEDTEPFRPRGARVVAPLARYVHIRLNRVSDSTKNQKIIKSAICRNILRELDLQNNQFLPYH